MIESTIVLAQVAGDTSAEASSLGLTVVGFLFVIIVLSLLAAVTAAMGAFFTKQAARDAAKAAEAALKLAEASGTQAPAPVLAATTGSAPASAAATTPTEPSDSSSDEDPALMAVVAAAVHTVIGDRPHRIVSVRSSGPGWAQEGRRQIFSSHRVR